MTDPVSELIIDAVASTVLPDITIFAVRKYGRGCTLYRLLAVNTFIAPDFASHLILGLHNI